MLLMSSSLVLSNNFSFINCQACWKPFYLHKSSNFKLPLGSSRSRLCGFIPNAKKNRHSRKRCWWQKFFFDEDGNWLGLQDDDMFENELDNSEIEELSGAEKFETWKRRAEATIELREARENVKDEDTQRWEDWLADGNNSANNSTYWDNGTRESTEIVTLDHDELVPEKGLIESVRDMVLGREDDDLLYEDGVFRYGWINSVWLALPKAISFESRHRTKVMFKSRSCRGIWSFCINILPASCWFLKRMQYIGKGIAAFPEILVSCYAKFLAVLIIVPWALDFVVHDYVLMPFLDRYVKKVPLAAQMLDVRRNQKLEMAKEIKNERARFRLEVEIGKSPPQTDEEVWWELRSEALELREKWRLENRQAFANIWSDVVFGISLFILLYCNQNKVALLKFTGYKIMSVTIQFF